MSLGQGAATIIGLAVIAGLVIVDVVLANDTEGGNTPSEVIRWVSRYTAVVPFGLGVLMGHWFHPGDDFEPILGRRSTIWLIGIGLVIFGFGLYSGWRRRTSPAWPWAVAGAVLGALLWPV
jgi:hypothetical protein